VDIHSSLAVHRHDFFSPLPRLFDEERVCLVSILRWEVLKRANKDKVSSTEIHKVNPMQQPEVHMFKKNSPKFNVEELKKTRNVRKY
jgi:hypothetical protein